MRFVVLVFTLAVFLGLLALLRGIGVKSDQMRKRFSQVVETERAYSDEELKKTFSERVFRPMIRRISESIRRSAGNSKPIGQSKANIKLDKQLKASGLSLTLQEFTFVKGMLILMFFVIGIALFLLLPLGFFLRLIILLVLLNIPLFGTSRFLTSRVKKRKETLLRELPETMDVLVVSVEAGLGLDAAILRQYAKNKSALLMELNNAIREVQMGVPRRTAFKEMAERCDVKELTAFVTALLQADQLGVPIKNVLDIQAERLRIERKQMIQARAAKAPIKIMLPTVLFIFPVIFIILLGPAAVNLIATFK
ncbi:MAG: type II secretion system F family protein [Eubacteriales bacterium]|jgi:tight adherence protein C|nr:type II secretion system F family protein [Eubacteriales bacterium]